jgi:hypothetical protein
MPILFLCPGGDVALIALNGPQQASYVVRPGQGGPVFLLRWGQGAAKKIINIEHLSSLAKRNIPLIRYRSFPAVTIPFSGIGLGISFSEKL